METTTINSISINSCISLYKSRIWYEPSNIRMAPKSQYNLTLYVCSLSAAHTLTSIVQACSHMHAHVHKIQAQKYQNSRIDWRLSSTNTNAALTVITSCVIFGFQSIFRVARAREIVTRPYSPPRTCIRTHCTRAENRSADTNIVHRTKRSVVKESKAERKKNAQPHIHTCTRASNREKPEKRDDACAMHVLSFALVSFGVSVYFGVGTPSTLGKLHSNGVLLGRATNTHAKQSKRKKITTTTSNEKKRDGKKHTTN